MFLAKQKQQSIIKEKAANKYRESVVKIFVYKKNQFEKYQRGYSDRMNSLKNDSITRFSLITESLLSRLVSYFSASVDHLQHMPQTSLTLINSSNMISSEFISLHKQIMNVEEIPVSFKGWELLNSFFTIYKYADYS